MLSNTDDAEIIRAIIAMAHRLKLKVVAEGVETATQLDFLRREGCDEVQGYYFARPMPATECTHWFRARNPHKDRNDRNSSDATAVAIE